MTTSAEKLFKKALKLHTARDLAGAAGLYQKILAGEPRHVDALYMLGTLRAEQGDLERAETLLAQAAKLAPASPMIQNNLGNVFLKAGRMDDAAICYQRALQLNMNMAETHFNLAQIRLRQQQIPDAIKGFEVASVINPTFVQAHLALANLYKAGGDLARAIERYGKVLELAPGHIAAWYGLGNTLAQNQDRTQAAACFRQLLALNPDDESARFALAALEGETPPVAPASHVANVFNELAPGFDHHLSQLGYGVPAMLRTLLAEIVPPDFRFANAIDLGCGTGMSGNEFRDCAARLSGVDLSANMLDLARGKGIYDALRKDDVVKHLEVSNERYDLVIAADLVIYIGDLQPLFAALRRSVAAGGVVLLSAELAAPTENCPYTLRSTGRYAQSMAYLRDVAADAGFTVEANREVDLRSDLGVQTAGAILALRRIPD